jgi:membrane protein implicated in regulation of membrane protease activity
MRRYTVDDDFMKHAKYWLTFGIFMRAVLCLIFGYMTFFSFFDLQYYLWAGSIMLFLLCSLPLSCIVIVITAIVFSIFQMEITLKELQTDSQLASESRY